jgi:hypothetical protein
LKRAYTKNLQTKNDENNNKLLTSFTWWCTPLDIGAAAAWPDAGGVSNRASVALSDVAFIVCALDCIVAVWMLNACRLW